MFSFMFGVLGSTIFWLFYGCISLFIGTFILKKVHKDTYYYFIAENKSARSQLAPVFFYDYIICIISPLIGAYIFWFVYVFIAIFYFILKLLFKNILLNVIKKVITTIDKIMPDISINFKKDE